MYQFLNLQSQVSSKLISINEIIIENLEKLHFLGNIMKEEIYLLLLASKEHLEK